MHIVTREAAVKKAIDLLAELDRTPIKESQCTPEGLGLEQVCTRFCA